MIHQKIFSTFKNGSRTYFYSSLFFPRAVRKDVFTLYSFVRVADDFVDAIPQRAQDFAKFRKQFHLALKGTPSNDIVIDSFVELFKRRKFNNEWVEAFLDSMQMDTKKKKYFTLEETLQYIYGSAEVIGLMMANILELPAAARQCAQIQGRAMQYVNFIRDIQEDIELGRTYLPEDELKKSHITTLALSEDNRQQLEVFIKSQIQRYFHWQKEAEKGYRYIPKRYRIPITTAAEMYNWTARMIEKNPTIVYQRKVKPKVLQILFAILKNSISG